MSLTTPCILWTKGQDGRGYGWATYAGRSEHAHRIAWRKAGRDIPEGMHLHHVCETRLCVNVEHLALIDPGVHGWLHNQHREATHCPQGHEYTPENTFLKRGHRQCRQCRRDYQRRDRATKQRELTPRMREALRLIREHGITYTDDPDAYAIVTSGVTGVYDGQAWINLQTCAALERRKLGKITGWGEESEFVLFGRQE